jgi:hypothetical protein
MNRAGGLPVDARSADRITYIRACKMLPDGEILQLGVQASEAIRRESDVNVAVNFLRDIAQGSRAKSALVACGA